MNVIRIKQFIASEVFKMEMEEQQRQEQQEVEEYGESELEDDVFEWWIKEMINLVPFFYLIWLAP